MSSFMLGDGWLLTTEHGSANGTPLLCHEQRAYHPADHEGGPAHRVAAWAYVLLRTRPLTEITAELATAQAFLQQWPDGPQLPLTELAEYSQEPM